jgi:hypothetical protein
MEVYEIMADAWELLIEHSTAGPNSDAWEHLSSQEGGGSGDIRYVAEKPIKFKTKNAINKFKTNIIKMKFKEKKVIINFSSKFKEIKLKQKEIDITFKFKKVIPEE